MWTVAKTSPRRWPRVAAVATVVLAGLAPASALAQTPVGSAVMYEVNEALGFIKGKRASGGVNLSQRLAKASLLGKEVTGTPGSPFSFGTFIQADAKSNVDLKTGKGPIHALLFLLNDLDPDRESLDTLEIATVLTASGELDLTTAAQGYAQVTGNWRYKAGKRSGTGKQAGTFAGIFLIPFDLGDGHYFYVNLGPDGPGTACDPNESICPLTDEEFTLGIPLTKLLVTFLD